MQVISDIMVVFIALFGLGYMITGKPKKKTHMIKDYKNNVYFYRKNNFTLSMLKIIGILAALYILGSTF